MVWSRDAAPAVCEGAHHVEARNRRTPRSRHFSESKDAIVSTQTPTTGGKGRALRITLMVVAIIVAALLLYFVGHSGGGGGGGY
jgi:hypothetical protein